MSDDGTVLEIDRLRTCFRIDGRDLAAVDGVSLRLRRGRTLAVVGESGCGKSVTSYSILRLIQPPGRIAGGAIRFRPDGGEPIDLAQLDDADPRLYRIRGGAIAMIFQEPMTALSPVHTIGDQITEAVLLHRRASRAEAERLAVEMLAKVGVPAPAERLRQYPHQLSGGQRQRVVIAMALVCRPQVLIADEPTTALDVTIQAQILRLLRDLQRELGMAILLITHNLGVVAQSADDVCVLYMGRTVEQGPVSEVLLRPRHPYTRGLLASLPGRAVAGQRLASIPGAVPPLDQPPAGCRFHPRCPHALPGRCDAAAPELDEAAPGHAVACVRHRELPP